MDKRLETILIQISESIADLHQKIRAGTAPQKLGLRRSARLPVAAALHRAVNTPIALITDRADHALLLAEELELWAPGALRLLFPEPNPLFYENAAWGDTIRRERLLTLTTLAAYHIPGASLPRSSPIIIMPARALMTRTLPRREFLTAARSLKRGQVAQIDELIRNWVAQGYEPVNTVIAPGQFARRGGILDVWPPAESYPIRIEFFGDEIETLRCFDPSTQRTLITSAGSGSAPPERILITPAREYLPPVKAKAMDPGAPTAYLDQAREFTEFDIPVLHSSPACLLDYLPLGSLVLIDDVQLLEDICSEIEEQAILFRRDAIDHQTLQPDFPIPYLTWSELHDSLERFTTIELGPSGGEQADEEIRAMRLPQILAERFSPGPRFGGRLKPLVDAIAGYYQNGEQVVIVSRQSARLNELWQEQTEASQPDAENQQTSPIFIEGSLSEGWIYRSDQHPAINLLTDGEIFGWRRPKPRYRKNDRYAIAAENPEANYSDLLVGDYVVHVDHGIGRFTGLVRRTVDNLEREYLRVEYADEAQLFVPVHQIDRLTRYVGSDSHPPSLSRLGSAEWKNVKSHVKEAVQEVAADLLELYARRSIAEGYHFNPDTTWQQELEASFPYIETDDQMRVLAEVKHDMETARPMDRLICGDVGYGKTEVALRAAFKAVNDNRQVAVLVPTTVLAQQHYHTFQERLAAFPLKVEMLSRFRSPQQQREIIDELKAGSIDIIIGTHRMLSSDVEFKDLGLLIIDEEQRFGVTHKEALKKMRTEVDVLTLTATPIPRTLYLALSGVRDISTINTPPEERLPIITHVGPYSPSLVRQAVVRELERGGQVFFVHNRVQTIGAMHKHLEKILPEARIAIAHGQMPEHELSQRMDQFTSGEVDILLSTSIIESGLDIPNANTLIVDRADTFGLAQLYQLRGRVGRGAQRAYAYFFRHKRKPPTEEGRQRLDTIAENTQLGAGFSIAMRDLEIRGTGDILGTRQHGHIAAVGFHLYTRLLAEAVRRLRTDRGLPDTAELKTLQTQIHSINVELPIPASIPAEYVPDKNTRLGMYRRLADLRTQGETDALNEELADRFGPPPEMVRNLLFQVRVRLLAEKAGVASITGEANQIVIRYPEGLMPANLTDLGPYARQGKIAIWMPYINIPEWPVHLVELLDKLANHAADSAVKSIALGADNRQAG
jgi:transcription-repair coupling factor (superfamily II helicase)